MRYYLKYRKRCDFFAGLSGMITVLSWPDHISLGILQQAQPSALLTITTVSMTLLGFSLTSSTFLVSNLRNEQFSLLKNSQHSHELSSILISNFWRLLLLAAASLGSYVIWPTCAQPAVAVITFLVIQALAGLATSIWLVSAILRVEFRSP